MKDAFKLHEWNWRTLEARLIIVLMVITSAKEVLFSLSLLVVGLMGGWFIWYWIRLDLFKGNFRAFVCLFVCWVSVQNRPHKLLVQI